MKAEFQPIQMQGVDKTIMQESFGAVMCSWVTSGLPNRYPTGFPIP